MRDDTPSRTAAYVAFARHAARLLPRELQLVDDPYGAAFASPWMARLIEWRAERGAGSVLANNWLAKRGILYMQVRTRVIDDAVRMFIAAGGRQLVLLGAGYDTRAIRLPELEHARVFEVDHPATQRHKREVLTKLGVDSPSQYVVWNFEQRPMAQLGTELTASGHDATAPTLTIWEGVTMYLPEPAIDASLRAIAGWSAAGSRLVMTYFATEHLGGLGGAGGPGGASLSTRLAAAMVARMGEPWRFGWAPAELPGYLAARGLRLESDVSMASAAAELLPPAAAALVASPVRRIAVAATESIATASVTPKR